MCARTSSWGRSPPSDISMQDCFRPCRAQEDVCYPCARCRRLWVLSERYSTRRLGLYGARRCHLVQASPFPGSFRVELREGSGGKGEGEEGGLRKARNQDDRSLAADREESV